MAKYFLTGIDDEQWRLFKAACDIRGLTIKEVLLDYIDMRVSAFRKHPYYPKIEHLIKKKGDIKK